MDFLKHTILLSPPNIEAVKEREDMVKEWTTTLYSHMVSKLEVLFIQHILEPLAPISSDQLPSYGRLIDVIRPWADKMRHLSMLRGILGAWVFYSSHPPFYLPR